MKEEEIIPICAWCDTKKEIEDILEKKHGQEVFKRISHSICEECKEKVMGILDK